MICAASFLCLAAVQSQTIGKNPADAEAVAGSYEGMSKSMTEGDLPLSMQLKNENGNLTGVVNTQFGSFPIIGGSFTGGQLSLRFTAGGPDEGTMKGQFHEGRLLGEWKLGQIGGSLDLKKITATGASNVFAEPSTIPRLTKEQWREDLRHFARELPERHKNAFHRTTREQFERAVASLDADIPRLQDHEILVRLMSIAATVGDGHTNVSTWSLFRTYPLSFYWFGDELRITRADAAHARALGARVVRVGKHEIGEARRLVDSLIPQGENEWFVRGASASMMRRPEVLSALGIVRNVERESWTFEDENRKRFTLELKPSTLSEEKIEWLSAVKGAEPLYRQKTDEPMWFTRLPDSQIVYFNFRWYPDTDEFRRRAGELFKFIDERPTKRLIIDMRQNGGGDFTKGRELLLPGLKQRAFINKPGGLYVITGRTTFSAAMVNVVDFKKELGAILVGEPTGARPNSYSEGRNIILPNSRLRVYYSIRFYQFSDEDVPSVMPDKRLDPTWSDFRNGRDSVLEWILAQP
jgi:hypothetical protein